MESFHVRSGGIIHVIEQSGMVDITDPNLL